MARWGCFEAVGGFSCLYGSNLLLCILAQLDILTLSRLRSVCKSWYDATTSPELGSIRQQEEEPWLILRERLRAPVDINGDAFIFDPDVHYDKFDYSLKMEARMHLWQPWNGNSLSASALPMGPMPPGSSLFLGLPSSLGGLVVGRLMEHRHTPVFAVGNPVLNQWKILPEAPIFGTKEEAEAPILGMQEDEADAQLFRSNLIYRPPFLSYALVRSSSRSSSYKLVVLEENIDVKVESLVQYDSEQETWTEGPGFSFEDPQVVKDDVYPLFLEGSIFLSSSDGLLAAYEPNSMVWHCISVPYPENFSNSAVFRHELNQLLLMAGLFVDVDVEYVAFGVWELDLKSKVWKLASRVGVKDLLGMDCAPDPDTDVKVQLVGDWVIFSCWFKDATFGCSFPPVSYHISTGQWHASSTFTTTTNVECCCAFQPSLTARP